MFIVQQPQSWKWTAYEQSSSTSIGEKNSVKWILIHYFTWRNNDRQYKAQSQCKSVISNQKILIDNKKNWCEETFKCLLIHWWQRVTRRFYHFFGLTKNWTHLKVSNKFFIFLNKKVVTKIVELMSCVIASVSVGEESLPEDWYQKKIVKWVSSQNDASHRFIFGLPAGYFFKNDNPHLPVASRLSYKIPFNPLLWSKVNYNWYKSLFRYLSDSKCWYLIV